MAINTDNIRIHWNQEYPGGAWFTCPLCEGTDTSFVPERDVDGNAHPARYRCWTCDFED